MGGELESDPSECDSFTAEGSSFSASAENSLLPQGRRAMSDERKLSFSRSVTPLSPCGRGVEGEGCAHVPWVELGDQSLSD
jgi:hypothetical protein